MSRKKKQIQIKIRDKDKTPGSRKKVEEHPVIPKGLQILAKHWKICYSTPNRVFYDLRGILKQDSIWFASYLKLKNKQGAKTIGPVEDTTESLTKKRILELREAVLTNNFSWIGVREIRITKPGKPGKLRPLGIPSIKDRLVLEVIRTILDPIYELNFSNLSHGFRSNRDCHTALKWLNTNMKDSIWFIEGDIQNYFTSIDHQILMRILERRIKDHTILRLIRTGLKAKVFQKDQNYYIPEVGMGWAMPWAMPWATPQGGILSPLLSNIYLNELDQFIENLCKQYQGDIKSGKRNKNPGANKLLRYGYKSLLYNLRFTSRITNETGDRNGNQCHPLPAVTTGAPVAWRNHRSTRSLYSEKDKNKKSLAQGSGAIESKSGALGHWGTGCCNYIRYADDFVIGVLGPRPMAIEIRDKVKDFLKNELNVELSLEKTKVTHITKGIEFLGYIFSRRQILIKQSYSGHIVTRKMTIPTLDVNMKRVIA